MRLSPRLPSLVSVAVLVVLVIVLIRGGGDGGDGPAAGPVQAKVLRSIDGDTIEASVGGRTEDVRYIGGDTPESVKPDAPVQCYALKASHFNEGLVEGRTVTLDFDAE